MAKWTFAGAAVLAACLVATPFGLNAAGRWLVIDDPLQHARSVVVLGGETPFRAMEAAAIYKKGWASEVWLTQHGLDEEGLAMARLGIDRPTEEITNREVLEHLGVPTGGIRVLAERTVNTADEVRAVARQIGAAGGNRRVAAADRVILVTSKYHARRVRTLWRSLIGERPEAVVRYTPDDPFEPDGWWRNTADALSVSREWFGLINAWTGFPVKSERR
jgi:uncharacterized SAM-binding protein YcdF (DUF218 family)